MPSPPDHNHGRTSALLGDTPERDYLSKLCLFNRFAEPELREAIASLALAPGMNILDAGCGSGQALQWLEHEVGVRGLVIGIDLAAAHIRGARAANDERVPLLQADLLKTPFAAGSFDVIWTVNTLNHLRSPLRGLQELRRLLKPGGRIAFGQSSLLPDMYFAWDSRLERLTNEAVRRCYRDRYRLDEQDLASVRSLVGLLRATPFQAVQVRTYMIERTAPLRSADEAYLLEAIFRGTWGARLSEYLGAEDFRQLSRLCDPHDASYALRRHDFHFLQTFTLAVGTL